jgi:hypothetical protein
VCSCGKADDRRNDVLITHRRTFLEQGDDFRLVTPPRVSMRVQPCALAEDPKRKPRLFGVETTS